MAERRNKILAPWRRAGLLEANENTFVQRMMNVQYKAFMIANSDIARKIFPLDDEARPEVMKILEQDLEKYADVWEELAKR